ncbi:hypothetical protein [Texcoconibacillus texcoconensis]|uniref:Uncharacterized protein n=1 Tax=Texcoconibacillus texcoconensis TaxID=1095777 RepID=A0A840QPQ9_9BACI|nr:hypothetical protein [Texcoconibacillus texcoconensis]MBB5173328.1 hypothetical protein [Texcoconibacillus texcoconensis]
MYPYYQQDPYLQQRALYGPTMPEQHPDMHLYDEMMMQDYRIPQSGVQPFRMPPQQGQQQPNQQAQMIKQEALNNVTPLVQQGVQEAQHTPIQHVMTKIAATAYLMGKGMDAESAYQLVHSWQTNQTNRG